MRISSLFKIEKSFNTQPPEGGWKSSVISPIFSFCFNTQPPEGGWICSAMSSIKRIGFNTQPPEGGWALAIPRKGRLLRFQHTAARRRLGSCYSSQGSAIKVSTHSRPKAAGKHICIVHICIHVSTHSRPKAAGINPTETVDSVMVSTHSRPKAAGNC